MHILPIATILSIYKADLKIVLEDSFIADSNPNFRKLSYWNKVTEKALSLSIPLNESRNQVNTKNNLKKKHSAVIFIIFTEDKSTAASVIFDGSLFFT